MIYYFKYSAELKNRWSEHSFSPFILKDKLVQIARCHDGDYLFWDKNYWKELK